MRSQGSAPSKERSKATSIRLFQKNLRDMIKGLRKASDGHLRLRMFRLSCALVPGDEAEGQVLGEGEAFFYRLVLRHLVDILSEDHLSGLKGAAFWTHFSKPFAQK